MESEVIININAETKQFDAKLEQTVQNLNKFMGNAMKIMTLQLASMMLDITSGLINMFVTSMNRLKQYNKQLKTDLDYIKFAIASVFEKIAVDLAQAILRILSYVNYLANAWFGINLFQNATIDKFKKQNKELNKSVSSAKELKKQLAGFDEATVLQDNTAGGAGGGASDTGLPSLDLSQIPTEVPEWVKAIEEFGRKAGEVFMKIIGYIKDFIGWVSEGSNWVIALGGLILLKLLGPSIIGGFGTLLGKTAIGGMSLAFGGVKTAVEKVIEACGGLGPALTIGGELLIIAGEYKYIYDTYSDLYKKWQDTKKLNKENAEWSKKIRDEQREIVDQKLEAIYADQADGEEITRNLTWMRQLTQEESERIQQLDWQRRTFPWLNEQYEKEKESILHYNDEMGKLYAQGKLNEEQTIIYYQSLQTLANQTYLTKEEAKKYKEQLNDLSKNEYVVKFKNEKLEEFKSKIDNLTSGLIKNFNNKNYNVNLTATDNVSNKISNIAESLKQKLGVVAGLIGFNAIPHAAKGAILNQPGRGVYYGGVNMAERGPEAVLPLTDSQQMSLLGESIGKYITINANITNSMNGRVISRELQRIQNDSDFASNR